MDREVSGEASKAGESTEIDAFCVAKQVKNHQKLANPQKLMLLEMAVAGKGINYGMHYSIRCLIGY